MVKPRALYDLLDVGTGAEGGIQHDAQLSGLSGWCCHKLKWRSEDGNQPQKMKGLVSVMLA